MKELDISESLSEIAMKKDTHNEVSLLDRYSMLGSAVTTFSGTPDKGHSK